MHEFKSLLVDVDAMAAAQPALIRAAEIARRSDARLRIVDVVAMRAPGRVRQVDLEQDATNRRRALDRLAGSIVGVRTEVDLLSGQPVDALIEDVERFDHDLLVRAHARDLVVPSSESVDAQLVRRCPCPVWSVGPGPAPVHPRIAAAVDLSMHAEDRHALNTRIVDVARQFSRLLEGSLIVVYVWQPVAETRVMSRASGQAHAEYVDGSLRRATADITAFADSFDDRLAGTRLELRRGQVDEAILELVVEEGIDVLVIGTKGRTGLARHVLGNTAERLLERFPSSLVAVTPPRSCTATR